MMKRIAMRLSLTVLLAGAAFGCDEQKQHDAAEKAGDVTEKAVNAVGDASRDAAHTVGNVVGKAGEKMKSAADDSTTRPTTVP